MRRFVVHALLALAFIVSLMVLRCANSPNEACTTAIEACNESVNNHVYDVLIDGARYGTLAPGSCETYEVAPGRHSVLFKISNSGDLACTEAEPLVEECHTMRLTCRG